MSLASYSDLRSAVADYVQRSDLTAIIPTFITLAESMINFGDAGEDIEPLRVREMEATVSTAPTNGDITLASDFLEAKRVTYVGTPRTPLTYRTPTDLDAMYPDGTACPGCPTDYTVIGSTLSIRPVGTGNVEYVYYQKIPDLADNPTNWLMTKAPTVYLYASLFQEAIYNQNPTAGGAMLTLYRNAIMGLERSDRGISAGSFVVRASMPAW